MHIRVMRCSTGKCKCLSLINCNSLLTIFNVTCFHVYILHNYDMQYSKIVVKFYRTALRCAALCCGAVRCVALRCAALITMLKTANSKSCKLSIIANSGGFRKVRWEGCRCILTKRARSARRPTEGWSFEGISGVSPPEHFLKVTLKSMRIKGDFSRSFLFIIAFILLVY